MRVLLLITLCALVCLTSSSPIDHSRSLVNRPSNEEIFRLKRSMQTKGHNVLYVKGGQGSRVPDSPSTFEPPLIKGEYICGNKVCKLKPGEIPPGCEGHICGHGSRTPELPSTLADPPVRKGEYICGNKVCRLKPGEIPPGCEGHICQYPLGGPDLRLHKSHNP